MKPRLVLHVMDTAAPRGAAISRMVEDLASGMDPARYQVHACFLEPGGRLEHFRSLDIPSTCIDWDGSIKSARGAARYARVLRSAEFSIIHQHTGGRLLTAMGRWLTHARIVRTLHFRADESTAVIPARCKLPKRDALIAVSRIVAEFSGDQSARVIYPGIEISRFSGTRQEHRGIVIGTACRLEPVKGLTDLLEAVARLAPSFPDMRVEIAGDGSLRQFLLQESDRLGITKLVSLLGWREDLPAIMAGWDIFAMPSLDEGFPIAGLEAMAAGLPIVASAAGGLPELVQDGKTGWLVPARAPAELAARLGDLIQNAGKREAMGHAGRDRVADFSVARMVDRTAGVYDTLLPEPCY